MKPIWHFPIALSLVLLQPTPQILAEPAATPPAPAGAATQPTPETQALSVTQQKLAEADKLYLAGDVAAAEKLYRQVKPPFPQESPLGVTDKLPEPFSDPEQLSPAGKVYWREAQAGWEMGLATRILIPLKLLVERHPEFIPGQLLYARAVEQYNGEDSALSVLERATAMYPNQPDLLKARIEELGNSEQWLEASVAARQFALLNPEHPQAAEFTQLADQNLERFRSQLRKKITGNAIAGGITGILGFAITGSPLGAFSAVQTAALLMEGETALGERVAASAKRQLKLVEDQAVTGYVKELGEKLAKLSGRNFEYEFYVVLDEDLNAFALPGGKVFVNAGAISHTDSEAELAGLLSHELAHAVLSHAFQQLTEGNLLANLTQYIPFGGPLTDLVMLDYSRDQERQADILGTRMLVAAGYAADGLHNLMVTLKEQKGGGNSFESFFSTHPATKERISYLQKLIQRSGYNRYAYEGVTKHAQVRARVKQLLAEHKKDKDKDREDESEQPQ
jgi:hypothetical protein